MELVLVRHATPGREGPPDDPDLGALGRAEAAAVAALLAPEAPDVVVSSPARRARHTAEVLARRLGSGIEVLRSVAELSEPGRPYRSLEEIRTADRSEWARLAGGGYLESGDWPAFRDRVVAGLDAVAAAHAGERVVVVTHGGVLNAYLGAVLGLDRGLFFAPAPASVSRVAVARSGVRSVVSLNETAHLVSLRVRRSAGGGGSSPA